MGLILHVGATAVDFDTLRLVETPDATKSHVPLPHHQLVEQVRYALGFYDHEIVEETHAIMPDGQRYFGLMTLKSPYGDYYDTLGMRNSHDKSWPVGLAFGSRVTVCDNTSFYGETVIKRRHTPNAKRDLPGIISGIVEPLRQKREQQHAQFQLYQATELDDMQVHDIIMNLYKKGAITVTKIADVLDAYEHPKYDWGPPSAWRLFNATTYALTGKVAENPTATQRLHDIIDSTCTRLAV